MCIYDLQETHKTPPRDEDPITILAICVNYGKARCDRFRWAFGVVIGVRVRVKLYIYICLCVYGNIDYNLYYDYNRFAFNVQYSDDKIIIYYYIASSVACEQTMLNHRVVKFIR